MLDRMEILLQGTFVVSTLFMDDFEKLGVAPRETENLVNRLREIRGVEAGALIIEDHELTRVSLRSKGRLDVAAVAQSLGGGGHHRAAGIRTKLPPHEIKAMIVKAVDEAWATPDTVRLQTPEILDEDS
jgi:phosphoesterase RecJ-like protein